jgi:hypothetical protein
MYLSRNFVTEVRDIERERYFIRVHGEREGSRLGEDGVRGRRKEGKRKRRGEG